MFYFCGVKNDNILIGLWCNGNTTDSGPVILGSNPGSPTQKMLMTSAEKQRFFYYNTP